MPVRTATPEREVRAENAPDPHATKRVIFSFCQVTRLIHMTPIPYAKRAYGTIGLFSAAAIGDRGGGASMVETKGALAKAFPGTDVTASAFARWAGIACVLAWAFWLNGASGEPADQTPWQLSYIVLSLMMAALGIASLKRPRLAEGRLGHVGAAMGAVGTLLLLVPTHLPASDAIQTPAYLLCGCALGLLYLQWGPFYAKVSTRQAVAVLFSANIAAAALKCLVHFLPDPASAVVAASLPILSAVLCSQASALAPTADEPSVHFSKGNAAGLWKMLAALAVFSFLAAFLIGHSVGNQSAVAPVDFAAARAFEVFVSVVVMTYVVVFGRPFNFAQLWRIVLIALAADVLMQTLLPEFHLLRGIESAAWDLIVLFSWLTIADIARHADADPATVFGLGWPFYTLPFAIGSFAATSIGADGLGATSVAVVLFVLLATSAFCLEVRDQDTKWIFSELDEGVEAPSSAEKSHIDARCSQIAEERGLSPRELEIMMYLCKGRTKAYIAETLYLSENTVRSHTKHIYTKLDVHSKRELMDLAGVE